MRRILGLAIATMLLAGCGGNGAPIGADAASQTATAAGLATQAQLGQVGPTSSFTPEPTEGPSPTPEPTPTSSPTPGPTPTGGAKWIMFSIVKRVLGAYQSQGIYRMAADGSGLEQIVGPGYTLLGVSPSGLRMLVSSGRSLYVMGTDASNQRLLTDSYYDLGNDGTYWASDEHKIVFIAGNGADNGVYVAHPDLPEAAQISQSDLNPIELYPSMDPSGVFWRTGACVSKGDCAREALMWSSIDGATQRTMRDGIIRPAASPLSDGVVYITSDAQGRARLEIASLDGSQPDLVYVFGSHFMDYGWAPDGIRLAVIVADRSDYSGILTGYRYYVADTALGTATELPWTLGENANLAWSPDGLQILFSGTMQTDAGFLISMKIYDLLMEQQHEIQGWDEFAGMEYLFIPSAYWVP